MWELGVGVGPAAARSRPMRYSCRGLPNWSKSCRITLGAGPSASGGRLSTPHLSRPPFIALARARRPLWLRTAVPPSPQPPRAQDRTCAERDAVLRRLYQIAQPSGSHGCLGPVGSRSGPALIIRAYSRCRCPDYLYYMGSRYSHLTGQERLVRTTTISTRHAQRLQRPRHELFATWSRNRTTSCSDGGSQGHLYNWSIGQRVRSFPLGSKKVEQSKIDEELKKQTAIRLDLSSTRA